MLNWFTKSSFVVHFEGEQCHDGAAGALIQRLGELLQHQKPRELRVDGRVIEIHGPYTPIRGIYHLGGIKCAKIEAFDDSDQVSVRVHASLNGPLITLAVMLLGSIATLSVAHFSGLQLETAQLVQVALFFLAGAFVIASVLRITPVLRLRFLIDKSFREMAIGADDP